MKFVNPLKLLIDAVKPPTGKTLMGNKGAETKGCESRKNRGFKRNKKRGMK